MNLSYAFFILSNTELIWRGFHDNMWTILTWNRHSLHSLLLIRVQLRKVIASVRLPTALRKDLQYVDKKHLQWPFRISGISWSIHVIHRDRTMPGCLYFCLYTKLLTTTSDPPNHPKHIVQPKLRTWWQTQDRKTKNYYSLNTYLPDSTLGTFEQIWGLDTINKLYKQRESKWFSWDFTLTGFNPKVHAH